MLYIYNTLSQRREPFQAVKDQVVKLFVCGPTVYEDAHIGHARTYISFDIIKRYLQYKGYTVYYLQNITDIDDKIIKRSQKLGLDPLKLARKYEKRYHQDMEKLGVNQVNFFPRASEHIDQIIGQIQTLIQKGYAYPTPRGVYFDISQFPDYGKLSRRKVEDLNVSRLETDPYKKNQGDFALWKLRDEGPLWDSPWGSGRPGWHIEDTAITEEYLGSQYDIHGGGLDLIFPHHEAEIAQMESASGKIPMVAYWMHTGFLNVSGEKMSKSLGNFITIRDLLENHHSQVFRFFVLSTHYRSPIDFSIKALEQSAKSFTRIKKLVNRLYQLLDEDLKESAEEPFQGWLQEYKEQFFHYMDQDFNTPPALAAVFKLTRKINQALAQTKPSLPVLKNILSFFHDLEEILGLQLRAEDEEHRVDESAELLELILHIREKLREEKEWELADKIRAKLIDLGYEIQD